MSTLRIRKPIFVFLALLLALTVLGITKGPPAPSSGTSLSRGNNVFALKVPSFLSIAHAEEASPTAFPVDEAGISAYFQSTTPINLADVRNIYRVIEVEIADYIIGSVPVPDWWEWYDVHLYVHRDGWFLAYYLNTDPVSKIIDWKRYLSTRVPSKLETVLAIAASSAGVAFPSASIYDFRYPNATHLILIVENIANGNDFTVQLPGTFSYYERSWSFESNSGGGDAGYYLDGVRLATHGHNYQATEGSITAVQLLPESTHTVAITSWNGWANGALSILYRMP